MVISVRPAAAPWRLCRVTAWSLGCCSVGRCRYGTSLTRCRRELPGLAQLRVKQVHQVKQVKQVQCQVNLQLSPQPRHPLEPRQPHRYPRAAARRPAVPRPPLWQCPERPPRYLRLPRRWGPRWWRWPRRFDIAWGRPWHRGKCRSRSCRSPPTGRWGSSGPRCPQSRGIGRQGSSGLRIWLPLQHCSCPGRLLRASSVPQHALRWPQWLCRPWRRERTALGQLWRRRRVRARNDHPPPPRNAPQQPWQPRQPRQCRRCPLCQRRKSP